MLEPSYFILTALTDQPLHGYGIMLAVRRLSEGRLDLRPGTLYAALDRLTEQGLLGVDREEIAGTRVRRFYALTDAGAAVLAAEVERLRANASVAAGRLRRRAAARPAPAGGP
jgi:DNA-binding PadR family transcriptional regulator